MNLRQALETMTSTLTPSIEVIGGEQMLLDALPTLNETLISRAIDVIHADWLALQHPAQLLAAGAARLPDISADGEFADAATSLLACALTGTGIAVRRQLNQTLLVVAGRDTTPGQAADARLLSAELAIQENGQILADTLSSIDASNPVSAVGASRTARALGRLLEARDEPWLRQVLHGQIYTPTRNPDAAMELALCALRDAFDGTAGQVDVLKSLTEAAVLFDEATSGDEQRSDAVALAAATHAVAAFIGRDADALKIHVHEMRDALDDLLFYASSEETVRFAAAAGAWLELSSTLAELEHRAATHGKFELRVAVDALLDAYRGIRSTVISDVAVGLRIVTRPRVIELIRHDRDLREGIAEIATGTTQQSPQAAAALSEASADPKAWAPIRRQPLPLRGPRLMITTLPPPPSGSFSSRSSSQPGKPPERSQCPFGRRSLI